MQIIFEGKTYKDKEFEALIQRIRAHKIPKTLFLKCVSHNQEDLDKFYNKLVKVSPPLVFAVSLLDEHDKPIYAFEKIKFDNQLRDKIESLKTSITNPSQATELKISEHKIAMLTRNRKSIPQSQRRIIPLPGYKGHEDNDYSKMPSGIDSFNETLIYNGKDADLIDVKNIEKNSEVIAVYNAVFPNEPRPSLQDIWESIVGKNSNLSVHKEVMKDFIYNYQKVKHGVFLNALPVVVDSFGKITKLVKYHQSKSKNILSYADYQAGDEVSLYSPVFAMELPHLPTKEDYISIFPKNSTTVTNRINTLFLDAVFTRNQKKGYISTLAQSMLATQKEKDAIEKDIKTFVDKELEFEFLGLTDIIVTSGVYSLFLVLRQINVMDIDLVKDLLSNRENFIQFASQEGLDKLSALARLDGGDKIWWQELVRRHKNSGDTVNFFELFALFNDFRTELGISEGGLPHQFPFGHIADLNMKSALNIAKSIIKATQNPAQLNYLDGIGLGLAEDYFASLQKKFRIITKEMGFAELNYIAEEKDLREIMCISDQIVTPLELRKKYQLSSYHFYRYIARNDDTSPKRFKYENFLAIEKSISSLNRKLNTQISDADEDLDYRNKSSLLYIAAVAGTGKGSDKQASSPSEEFSKFLQALRIFAAKFNIDNIEDIIHTIHEVGLCVETCPSLSEISEIINKLSVSNQSDGVEIIRQAFTIIKNHGEEAVEIFANFAEIVNKSKAQNTQEEPVYIDIADLLAAYTKYNFVDFDKDIQPLAAKAFSLFVGQIDSTTITSLPIEKLEQQKYLFQKLATIDLGKTSCLLSSEIFSQLLEEVRVIKDEKALHTAVQGFFIEKGLDIKFNSLGVSRSKISLTSALKSLIEVYKENYAPIRKKLDTYVLYPLSLSCPLAVKNIKEGLDEVNAYIEEIEKCLNLDPINEQLILKIFDKADSRLSYLKDDLIRDGHKTTINSVRAGVILAANKKWIDPNQIPYIEAYFNTFSMAVFMDSAIELSVKDTIEKLVKDVFGDEDDSFIKYLMKYMGEGSKPVRFGTIESEVDPSSPANDEVIRNLLHNVDGIILYADELYYIQQNKPLKVIKLDIEDDEKREVANQLKSKITKTYKVVGVDGFRIIKLNDIKVDPKTTIEQSLYKHVRTMSLSQDAIISYKDKKYYYNFLEQVVTCTADAKLNDLFIGNFENREAITPEEKQIFKDVIGVDKLHDELSLILRLDVDPTIFPSQNVDKYNRKLDKFTDVLNKLEELKDKNLKLFNEYFTILKALQEKISVNDLINVLDLLMTLMPLVDEENKESPSSVLENITLLFNQIKDLNCDEQNKINLSALISSLEELSKNKTKLGENVKDLLQNLIPFTLSGAAFPLDIFLKNQDKSKEFLKDLLKAAAILSNSGEKDFFDNLEKIKNKFTDNIEPILSTLLMALVKDTSKISLYKSIYAKLENLHPHLINKYVEIFKALSSLPDAIELEDIDLLLDGIKAKEADLEKIYTTFFACEPYLDKDEFLKVLSSSEDDFNEYLKFYDRHPYKEENREKMEVNFGTNRVLDVIDGIISLPNNVPLSFKERAKLAKEFTYVNAISMGQHKLYLRDADGLPIEVNGKTSFYLHEFSDNDDVVSREDLIEIAQKLKDAFYKAEANQEDSQYLSNPNNNEARRLALQYIAVMREVYYRTTKIIPNSTQIITIINALNNPSRQLEEIETAEGKSVTTALFSALICAKGCTVLVPTSSKSLVSQDYLENHNNLFFKALGFNSTIIDQEQGNFELEFGGINYGTSRDIDSLIAEYKITGRSLRSSDGKTKYPLACVKDEQDNDLDDLASRTIAVELPENKDILSPTWIITAINKFVESTNYRRIEKVGDIEPDDEEQDLRNLVRYLRNEASANKDDKIEASRHVDAFLPLLKNYLAVACQVQVYKNGVDYQVIEKDLNGDLLKNPVATPVNPITSEVERGNTFPDSRQAFLHDILNRSNKYPGRTFEIKIDSIEIDTKSNKSLTEDFDYFVGLSATSGSKQELLEVAMPVSKIPPHFIKNRKILSPQAVKTENKHSAIINAVRINGFESDFCPTFVLNVLVHIVEAYQKALQVLCYVFGKQYTPKDKQPVLIFVNDPVEAEDLYNKFRKIKNGYNLQYSNGTETSEEYEEKIKKGAGKKNTLTIVVPKDGRGIDYDSDYPEGIFGIKAFNSNLRGGVQVLGRVGRKGKPGKFLEIVDGGEFEYNSLFQRVFGISHAEKKQQVKNREDKLNTSRAVERQYHQLIDAKIQVVLQQFDKIRLEIKNAGLDDAKLLLLRGELLRRIKNLENKKLDLANFQAGLINEWNKFAKKEFEFLLHQVEISPEVIERIKFYRAQDIKNQFIYAELEHNSTSPLKQRIKKISAERTSRILDKYEDGCQAILEFDDSVLSIEEKKYIKISKAIRQLKSLFRNYKWLGLKYESNNEENSSKEIFINLINLLNFRESFANQSNDAIKFYPVALEMLEIYKDVEDCIDASEFQGFHAKIQTLQTFYSQESTEAQVFAYFEKHLGFIDRGLYLLGIKSEWFKSKYASIQSLAHRKDILGLYKELYNLKTLLENNTSIFPFASYLFGTYDLKKLIKQTIDHIDSIKDTDEISAREYNCASEEGQCAGLFEAYLSINDLQALRKKVPENMQSQWDSLIACIDKIKKEQPGFAAVEEILALLQTTKIKQEHYLDGKSVKNPSKSLFFSCVNSIIHVGDYETDPKIALIKKLEKMCSKIRELEKERIKKADDSIDICITQDKLYLEAKQQNIKNNINTVFTEAETESTQIESLEIFPGYFGNSQGYELRIKYSGDVFANPTFVRSIGAEINYVCMREDVAQNQELEEESQVEVLSQAPTEALLANPKDSKPKARQNSILNLFSVSSEPKKADEGMNETASVSSDNKAKKSGGIFSYFFGTKKSKEEVAETKQDESRHSDSESSTDIPVASERKKLISDPERERQAKFSRVLVKKFNSLSDLLDFEINFLPKNDPRHRAENSQNLSAHVVN